MGDYWVPGVKNTADALSTYGFFVLISGAILVLAMPLVGISIIFLGGTMQFLGGYVYMRYHKGKGNPYEMEDENLKKTGVIYIIIGILEITVIGFGSLVIYSIGTG